MGQKMTLRFDDASLSNISDLNASFARGRLKVMYTGGNRNGSFFDREVIEEALPSLANIPIVAHYDLDANEIGSHDVELVRDGDGLRLRNITEPCGVVPESAGAFFSEEADEAGVTHEYLVVEPVILWKRQEVYRHISEDLDGKVDHSMEVSVSAFHKDSDSDLLHVDAFEFEALCLLESARPCFEGSALELFSAKDFKEKMEEMMAELRETFSMVNPPETEIDIDSRKINTEGGMVLDEKLALLAEYELDADALDFSLDDFSVEELREKFEAMKGADAEPEEPEGTATFELSGNLRKVLADALMEKTVTKPWGEENAFWMEDYDQEAGFVYAQSAENWNFYAFPFTMNGDNAVIDFDAGKRVKRTFVAFDEGAGDQEVVGMFAAVEQKYVENDAAWAEKYSALEKEFNELKESTADIEELREFRADAERKAYTAAREEVFAMFEDLEGNEDFEALRSNGADLDIASLEKECYAIRGMANIPAKFAEKEKTPKLKVVRDTSRAEKEPYGGLFMEFGPRSND